MLRDFVPLKPGDTVIQNGANSAVGQMVIQLCKIWKYNTVNIVRDRPNIHELKVLPHPNELEYVVKWMNYKMYFSRNI